MYDVDESMEEYHESIAMDNDRMEIDEMADDHMEIDQP